MKTGKQKKESTGLSHRREGGSDERRRENVIRGGQQKTKECSTKEQRVTAENKRGRVRREAEIVTSEIIRGIF
jgi:hypothetical protein